VRIRIDHSDGRYYYRHVPDGTSWRGAVEVPADTVVLWGAVVLVEAALDNHLQVLDLAEHLQSHVCVSDDRGECSTCVVYGPDATAAKQAAALADVKRAALALAKLVSA
jgi:hypothetical protein